MLLGFSLISGFSTEVAVRHSGHDTLGTPELVVLLVLLFSTEAVVRHSGRYLQCSRGDCLMLGDAEVDLISQNI